ncbi:MAG: glycosyltransferase family 4 protein [Bacteroidales bacterium]
MKIHVIGTRGIPDIQGGVEKHCEYIYPILAEKNDILVYRRKPFITKENKSISDYKGVKLLDLPTVKIKGVEALFHSFIAVCHSLIYKPDIVHIHNIGPSFFSPLLKLRGIKVVMTYHSPNYEHNKWGTLSKFFLRICERISLIFSNYLIFVNPYQRNKFRNSVLCKSTYIPNGIISTRECDGYILEKWGLCKNNYILAVGRITEEKGFDLLIRAYKELMLSNIKLVIAGGADHNSNYAKQLIDNADENIIFTGVVSSAYLNALYASTRLFVLSSRNEGFPLVLLEAMSFNIDVLVSDIPATQIVTLNENSKFLVNSIESLKEALNNKLSSSIDKFDYNINEYKWEIVAQKTLDVYKYVISD